MGQVIRTRHALIALAVAAAPGLGVAVAASSSLSAAAGPMHAALQIRPGLWEFHERPRVTGDTVVSDEMTANVPASGRAEFLAEMRRMMAEPQTVRECLTQAKFERQVFRDVGPDCSVRVVSNTASRLELHSACRSESGDVVQTTDHGVVVSSSTSVASSMHAVSTRQGMTMTVDSAEDGRWLSAVCGGVNDIQVLP